MYGLGSDPGDAIPSEVVERYVAGFSRPGRLTGALNYYRANLGEQAPPLADGRLDEAYELTRTRMGEERALRLFDGTALGLAAEALPAGTVPVRRRSLAREVYERVSFVGVALIVILMYIALQNDVTGSGPR